MLYIIPPLQQNQETLPIKNLVSFRKGIKREETAYPTLKDERYFDSFSRSLYITARSHECEEVLDPEYTPSNSEKEFFDAKQVFMFSVLDQHLLTDIMGKTIVRKYMCIQLMHNLCGKIFKNISSLHPNELLKREDSLNMSPTQFWMTTIKVYNRTICTTFQQAVQAT